MTRRSPSRTASTAPETLGRVGSEEGWPEAGPGPDLRTLTVAYFAAIRTGSRASSSAAARATAVPSKNRGFCVPQR